MNTKCTQALKGNSTVEPRYNKVELYLKIGRVKIVICAFEANIFANGNWETGIHFFFFFFFDVVQQSQQSL